MKRLLLSLCVLATTATATMAQSERYQQAMQQQTTDLDSSAAFNANTLQQKANTFERIAAAEQTQWLPYYYAGYCQLMQAFVQNDKTQIDALADKAAANLDKAESLSPKNSEISCLRSLLASARIVVDPATRGAQYGPEAGMQLEQARQYNPENPRVYLLMGQGLLFTPPAFGGDPVKAKEVLKTALDKYSTFKPESNIAPRWGEPYARQLLTKGQAG